MQKYQDSFKTVYVKISPPHPIKMEKSNQFSPELTLNILDYATWKHINILSLQMGESNI